MNRYEGNTGRFTRVEERGDGPRSAAPPQGAPPRRGAPPPRRGGLAEQLSRLLPGTAEGLETEDLLLLLILYLMYRESGDSELLVIMGAMFLL